MIGEPSSRLQARNTATAAGVGLVRGVSLRISPHAGCGRGWLGGDQPKQRVHDAIAARDNAPPDHNKFNAQP
jgi:hypothetical protein